MTTNQKPQDVKSTNEQNNIEWGIPVFDDHTGGLHANTFNILESADFRIGSIVLGQFLYEGLKNGERVALITFDDNRVFLNQFKNWYDNLDHYLEEEQFYYINYKPAATGSLGIGDNYMEFFEELKRLCNDELPARIAINQLDALFPIGSIPLVHISAQKLNLMRSYLEEHNATVLANLVTFNDESHKQSSIALQKVMDSYFLISNRGDKDKSKYLFEVVKYPWLDYDPNGVRINYNIDLGKIESNE